MAKKPEPKFRNDPVVHMADFKKGSNYLFYKHWDPVEWGGARDLEDGLTYEDEAPRHGKMKK